MARGADDGIAALEWLLVVAGSVTLAVALAAALQAAVDRQSDPPAQRQPRILDADIAAAAVENDARQAIGADPAGYDDASFAGRCNSLVAVYADVVAAATWRPGGPRGAPAPDLPRCQLTLR